MHTKRMTPTQELARRKAILQLAAEAQTDVRTAARAIDEGLTAIRSAVLRARIGAAGVVLGMALDTTPKVRA